VPPPRGEQESLDCVRCYAKVGPVDTPAVCHPPSPSAPTRTHLETLRRSRQPQCLDVTSVVRKSTSVPFVRTLTTPRTVLLPLSAALMRKRLETDDFELCCELPAGPQMQHFGPQWPGEAVVTFPMLLGLADEHGNVDLAYAVIDRENGEAVGQLGTKGPISADGVAEIGYGMNDAVRRRGLCTEAVGALVDELVSRPEVTKVVAETAVAPRTTICGKMAGHEPR